MRLESVTRVEKARDRYLVTFDDGTAVKVSSAQLADFGLHPGRELTDGELEELRGDIELSSSKARALRILGNRTMSAREVENRLTQKGGNPDIARETVGWLEEIGAVNDAEYASMIVRHYTDKGYGIARIRDELFRRGILREMWDDALEELGDMDGAALSFLERKLRGSDDKGDVRRAADALYRRGFTGDEVRNAVRRYLDNVRETEDMDI